MLSFVLACYLIWHLRRAWAPLIFTDENPPAPANPSPSQPLRGCPGQGLLPARPAGQPNPSFRGLLEHLATLTRNQVRFTGT